MTARLLRLAALVLLVSSAICQDDGVPALSEGLLKDRAALLAFKARLSSFGTSQISSWRAIGNPCFPTPWKHITCKNGRVSELNLANRGVVGELAVGLRQAPLLEVLNLDSNRFTGGIPDMWASRGVFTRLRTLILSNNELTGLLPNWNRAGAWHALQTVDLSGNKFYGGLPTNWLGKSLPLRSVQYLDLSNNLLGTTDGTTTATKAQWCPPEGSLKPGSGWCPAATPIVGTAASLVSLDLSNNGLTGEIPSGWPRMFPRLQYLMLQFNSLRKLDGSGNAVPAALPGAWTSDRQRGFPALSMLVLFPGNDNLCSLPDDDGTYQDVNLDATYQVAEAGGEVFGNGNARLCPVAYTDDNPVDSPALILDPAASSLKYGATWDFTETAPAYIWGFKVTLYGRDPEGQEWSPVGDWNGVRLRTYTLGNDGGVADSRLSKTGDTYTLTLTGADYPTAFDKFRVDVAVVNLDGVESSVETSAEVSYVAH